MDARLRRSRRSLLLALLLGATLTAMVLPAVTNAATVSISLSKVVGGLSSPTQITSANDGTNRLFVVEQRGTVRVIQNGVLQPGYFLDIRSRVELRGERGLLGIAFHPNFKTNHRFFVYYTRPGGDIMLARFTTNSTRTKAVASSIKYVMRIEHSAHANHNGGALAFGPHGYLYIGVGDGGGAGDPGRNAQSKNTLLGKILRINVNKTGGGPWGRYANPSTNPYAGSTPGLGEIWARGLRNPWRISFDRGTGQLFIADVGQDKWEEIDREAAGFKGGRNYGWNVMEGRHCYTPSKCPMKGDALPVAEYSHAGGNCAITGGYVYRGPTQAALVGQYVFADYCSGRIWTMPAAGLGITQAADTNQNITSFGESENGELYAVTSSGEVFQVLAS